MCRIVAVYVLALVALSTSVEFKDCGSEVGKFSKASVTGCTEKDESCTFKVGDKPSMSITFESNEEVGSVIGIAVAKSLVPVRLFGPDDLCKMPESGLKCPVEKGVSQTFTGSFTIRNAFSGKSAIMEAIMLDENNKAIVCVQFPATIEEVKKEKEE